MRPAPRHRRPVRSVAPHRPTACGGRRSGPGFTLVEVLVALAIVAIALAAGSRAAGQLAGQAERETQVLLAQLCAENELVRVRLAKQMPSIGDSQISCEQGGQSFRVELAVRPTPNPSFRRVDAQVLSAATPVLRLSTVVGRN